MKRQKSGVLWLFFEAWNAANFGINLWRGRYWWALVTAVVVVMCAVMAYRRLTKHSEARLTITVRRPKP